MRFKVVTALLSLPVCMALLMAPAFAAGKGTLKIGADNIGGVVKSSNGPEAGVWVVAETDDLPTHFIKIVVTDDEGRYLLPELPAAKYHVWVRGYGLVDSKPVDGTRGKRLDLAAVVAPDGRTAAEVYPANYWLSLMTPVKGDMTDHQLLEQAKQCMLCHALGLSATRNIEPELLKLGDFHSGTEMWDRRVRSGPLGGMMSGMFLSMGNQRKMFADWTDRIAAGDYPKQAPPRPHGVERTLVVTMWDWATPTTYMHDVAASDVRNPSVNANGLVYAPSQTDGELWWLDPKTNQVGSVPVPTTIPQRPTRVAAASPIWGTSEFWPNAAARLRSSAVDQKGRGWFSARIRPPAQQPAFCKAGSSNKFAQYFPIEQADGQVAFYDPQSKKVEEIDFCTSADHNQFGPADKLGANMIFFGQNDALGWVNADEWDKTHDVEASIGWIPAVIDTNGDGKITKPWTEPNEAVDPTKDHRISFPCYKDAVSPVDGSVWCSGIGPRDRLLVRISLGANPPETSIAEVYAPPAEMNGLPINAVGGIDIDSNGVVWQNWRGTDHVTAFDRRKCKVLNGPTATGDHCPEGWTAYRREDVPTYTGSKLHSDLLYLMDVDREGVFGLGENAVMQQPTNSNSLSVLVPKTGEWVDLVVPYPMGLITRSINWRIDDPKAGWKGRGLWTAFANFGIWKIEGGKGQTPKVIKMQLRPTPLAN